MSLLFVCKRCGKCCRDFDGVWEPVPEVNEGEIIPEGIASPDFNRTSVCIYLRKQLVGSRLVYSCLLHGVSKPDLCQKGHCF